ncbi:MAG: prephenate dehydrogenase [Prolixibacteraceae bacterium]|nr:prephenate dehydrogenase [Prolixibacteraceae bacterium]
MIVTILGLGLMGGSMAKDIRKKKFATEIVGIDSNPLHAQKAIELGLVDRCEDFETGIKTADMVIVAIPVDKIAEMMPAVLGLINPSATVTDVGSTKGTIASAVEDHPMRGNYVAAHPMSGTENSGPGAAIEGLFENKICIVCDHEKSRPQHLALVEKMFHAIGMDIAYMTSDEQDHSTAHVSHLPHVTAFALANAVLESNNRKIIFELASGGFRSTARLAKSSPEMWGPIFRQNRQYVVESIDQYIKHLEEFRDSIQNNDPEKMNKLMNNANRIREILNGENKELIMKKQTTTKLYPKQ